MSTDPRVAFTHDHLVTRGGADRVLVAMLQAVPQAQVVTSFYEPVGNFPELADADVRTSPLNRSRFLRSHHRATLPAMPLVMSSLKVDADVVVSGTSGWAQGIRTDGRKVVYFHAIARWVHERDSYVKGGGLLSRVAASALAPVMRPWDRRTMATGDRFLAASEHMCRRVAELYDVEVELLRYPNQLGTEGPQRSFDDIEPGYFFCASRLAAYKNVDVLAAAFEQLPHERLVVAGDGPMEEELRAQAPANVHYLGRCDDAQLRWLYQRCEAVITSAIEPFGLTPVEGGAFGKPTVALRAGGFLETVVDGETGMLFDRPDPGDVVDAVRRLRSSSWEVERIVRNAGQWHQEAFAADLRRIIAEEHR